MVHVTPPMARFTNRFILVISILLLALGVALYQVNTLIQELVPSQQPSASVSQKHIWRSSGFDFGSALCRRELERWHRANENNAMDILKLQVQGLLKESSTYREEMEEVKERVLELERQISEEIKEGNATYREEMMKGRLSEVKRENSSLEEHHNPNSIEFSPLKAKISGDFQVHHYFMSALKGRGMKEGPPELFFFPQAPNDSRVLCLRGNSTSDGMQNGYAFVENVPTGAHMLPGITLLSDTFWDFTNPWHSMFNLLQFVYRRVDGRCSHADNLLLFHKGEFRTSMGSWIKSLLQACGLPTKALGAVRGGSNATICFEQAVVSRSGMAGMKRPLRSRIIKEARCQARTACHVQKSERGEDSRSHVNVTLIVRKGARGFVDEAAWQRVVKDQCDAALNCSWSVMYVANLSFCQQVEAMTYTDILVSAHGAQLANIIFMEPGGSLLEMFPFGWLEMAGQGQFVYRNLAAWIGLQHEGYWRDPSTTPCPNATNAITCNFSHYKDQPLGINVTYIGIWLKKVIEKFKDSSLHIISPSEKHHNGNPPDVNTCECDSN